MIRSSLNRKTRLQSRGPLRKKEYAELRDPKNWSEKPEKILVKAKPLRKRRKTRKGQVPEAVLDALWSKRIRAQGRIEAHGDTPTVGPWSCVYAHQQGKYDECRGVSEAAHVYSRKYKAIRWDLDNGVPLCSHHHAKFHDNPVMAGRFYESWLGRELLDTLWIKAQAGGKVDRVAVKAYLEGR